MAAQFSESDLCGVPSSSVGRILKPSLRGDFRRAPIVLRIWILVIDRSIDRSIAAQRPAVHRPIRPRSRDAAQTWPSETR